MTVDFLRPAENELFETIEYYNLQSEGLGLEFAAEVKRTIERIMQFPNAWTSLSERTRRCRTNRFPYAVIFQIRGNLILVIAIQSLHAHPESWRSRLSFEDQ